MKDIINLVSYLVIIGCVVMLIVIAGSLDCDSITFEVAIRRAAKWLGAMVLAVVIALMTGEDDDYRI